MDSDWWQNTIIYVVFLPSFKDSNKDGIGDFRGLISKLDYFHYLGIETLLLSPFYPSPNKDNGYDITDHTAIDPRYGTMQDFDDFMVAAKAQGLNIMIDFVANHTSNEHEWFKKSVKQEEPYKDYYIWVDGKKEEEKHLPPNNWLSVFGGSAWEWSEERQQFYLHQFLCEQPDLNLNNPKVKEDLANILRFWLDKGIDGIRIDAVSHFYEDEQLLDEPVAFATQLQPNEYYYLDHIYTHGNHRNLELLDEWRELLDDYGNKTGKYKCLLTEGTESIQNNMLYYGLPEKALSDLPFNFQFLQCSNIMTGYDLQRLILNWIDNMPLNKRPNWILGNHDHGRIASKVGDSSTGLIMVQVLLPGLPMCYYGDELGMKDVPVKFEEMKDSFALRTKPENSRDPSRTPMPWNKESCAGFTSHTTPWLPIHEDYETLNVEVQKENPYSVLEVFRKLVLLKKQPAIDRGLLDYPHIDGNIFSMIRLLETEKSYLIALNLGNCSAIVDFTVTSAHLPDTADLVLTNIDYLQSPYFCHLIGKGNNKSITPEKMCSSYLNFQCSPGENLDSHEVVKVDLSKVFLLPKQALVLAFMPRVLTSKESCDQDSSEDEKLSQ